MKEKLFLIEDGKDYTLYTVQDTDIGHKIWILYF